MTPSPNSKLRIGVIGTGAFAEACHVPGLQSHPQAEVVALCGRRYDRARALADRLNVPDVHTDYNELCARADLDAVTIVTPNVEHLQQAMAAFDSGKHVFCEKPLAMALAEAREMVRSAEASGRIHQVAFTYRYLYGVQELRRRVRQGDIGAPYYLRIQYDCWEGMQPDYQIGFRDKLNLAGGGMLYDVGSHFFDIARFILGPLEMVAGFSQLIPRQRIDGRAGTQANVETDDIAAAWFVHENGVRGQWFASRATPSFGDKSYLEVIGLEGALRATLSRGSVDVLKVSSPTRPAWEELPLPEEARDKKPHSLGMMMRSFVDACLCGKLDGDVDASFYDGLAAQQALAAVTEATTQLTWVRL
jgi:predicted dehydrogenase